jgi:hypothetical protein
MWREKYCILLNCTTELFGEKISAPRRNKKNRTELELTIVLSHSRTNTVDIAYCTNRRRSSRDETGSTCAPAVEKGGTAGTGGRAHGVSDGSGT